MTRSTAIVLSLAALLTTNPFDRAPFAAARQPAEGESFELKYAICPDGRTHMPALRVPMGTKKPAGITAEPKFEAKPQYGSLRLVPGGKGKPFLAAMEKTGLSNYTLYIDRNRNGDLAEEKAIALTRAGTKFQLAVPVGGKQVDRLFAGRALASTESTSTLILRERGAWQGEIRVGKTALNVMLTDGNANSIYNDAFRMPEPGRPMLHTPDSFLTEPASGPTSNRATLAICPATLASAGKLYNTTVAADGSSITVTAFEGKTATLTATDGLSAMLYSGQRMVTSTARDGKLLVPAGKLRLLGYECSRGDARDADWMLTSWLGIQSKSLEAAPDRTVPFPGGLPVRVVIDVGGVIKDAAGTPGKVTAGSTVRLCAAIVDAAGSPIQIRRPANTNQRVPRTFVVVRQGKKELARGRCGSNPGGAQPYAWDVPTDLTGTVTVTATTETGPFETRTEAVTLEVVEP